MATRLYPNTRSHATLEILAEVPCGTSSQLTEIVARDLSWFGEPLQIAALASGFAKAAKDNPESFYRTEETCLKELRDEFTVSPEYVRYLYKATLLPEASVLEGFLIYGWGPVQACPGWLADSGTHNTDYAGSVHDLEKVAYLLDRQNTRDRCSYRQDRSHWSADPRNTRLETRTGSMFLSEIEGLHWE